MKNNQTILIIAILILAGMAVACGMFGGSESNSAQNSNSGGTSNASSPAPTAPLRTFESATLVTAVKANEPEFAKLVGKDPIIVVGDVWSGGDYGPARLEYWGREGRISCSGYTSNLPPEKQALWRTLEKATGDYLNNRVKRMPLVKAKGIYASSTPPAAKPDDHWKIYLDECELLEVAP